MQLTNFVDFDRFSNRMNLPDNNIAAYHEFLLKFKPEASHLHLFFEGREDISFYLAYLRPLIPEKLEMHTYLGGKKMNLLKVSDLVRQKLATVVSGNIAMYFVDKDLDDLLPAVALPLSVPNYVYQTDTYSIENHIASSESLRVFCLEILKLNTEDTEQTVRNFEETQLKFNLHCRELMTWIIFHRILGNRPNLNNTTGDQVYRYQNFKWQFFRLSRAVVSQLDNNLGVQTDYSEYLRQRRGIRSLFSSCQPKQYVRGKYELFFFIRFLKAIIANSKLSCHHPLNPGSLIDLLSPRVKAPHNLISYCNGFLGASNAAIIAQQNLSAAPPALP